MCLLLCSYKSNPDYPLILAANRDELHSRPAAEAQFWNDEPSVLAGRDLQAGGTWLGITKHGRIAAVTNYHDKTLSPLSPKSRGSLVSDFLKSDSTPREYAEHIIQSGHSYQGFTLVFGTVNDQYHNTNSMNEYGQITPGIHGLSNRILNEKSFKVVKGKEDLRSLSAKPDSVSCDALFSLLGDRTRAPAPELTSHDDTSEEEGSYSSIFIVGKESGTRCSTAILIDNKGNVRFSEKTFSPEGIPIKTVQYEFVL
jgi:uncharacterized protein with NRDE domain